MMTGIVKNPHKSCGTSRLLPIKILACVILVACWTVSPSDAVERLTVQSRSIESDGMESNWLELSSGPFEGRRYSGGDWMVSSEPTPGESITFYQRTLPAIKMHFSVFGKGRLIQDLSDESLSLYTSRVAREHSEDYQVEVESQSGSSPQPFMGQGFRKLVFECTNRDTGIVEKGICDFITLHESGFAFRLRFTAPIESFERMRPVFSKELNRFTLESFEGR